MNTISCALCRAALPLLLEVETDVSASPARGEVAPATVAEHLATCADCSRELALLRAVRDSSRSLGEVPAPATLRLNVRAALQAEATEAAARQTDRGRGESAWRRWLAPRRAWQPAFTWSGGAALAALALFATTRSQPPLVMPVPQDESHTTSPAPETNAQVPGKTDVTAKKAHKAGATPAGRPAPAASAAPAAGRATQGPPAAGSPAIPPAPAPAPSFHEPAPIFGGAPRRRSVDAATAPPRVPPAERAAGRATAVPAVPASPAEQAPPAPVAIPRAPAPTLAERLASRSRPSTGQPGNGPSPIVTGGAGGAKDETAATLKPAESRHAPDGRPAPPAPMMAGSASNTIVLAPQPSEMGITATAPLLADAGAAGPPGAMASKAAVDARNATAEDEAPRPKTPFVRLALLPRTTGGDDTPFFNRSLAAGAGSAQMAAPGAAGPQGPAGPQGAMGPQGPANLEASGKIEVPMVRQGSAGSVDAATTARDKPRSETSDGAASGGLRPPSGVFGMRASGTRGQVGERGSSWRSRSMPSREKSGARDDDGKRAKTSPAPTSPALNGNGNPDVGNGFVAGPRTNSKATLYGTLPPLSANTAPARNTQPLLTSEVRHAVLMLTPPRAAQNVRVCVTVDGLEFPAAREGVLWRGDVARDTDLMLPLAVRAVRAGTVRARVTLETADGTILAAGTVELFAAP